MENTKGKKVFMSVDIEGINGICNWDETEAESPRYQEFKKELQREVNAACRGAIAAGATEIVIKDAHDSARNLDILDLPECVKLLRGWEGGVCSMMAGLDETFDCVMFVGYHSASRSQGNSLSHTMNSSRLFQVTINDEIVSEFNINSLYASYLNVPVAFLSGDKNLTEQVKAINENIETVASKTGLHCAVISEHPNVTIKKIENAAKEAVLKCGKENIVKMPKHFDVKIQYKDHNNAYRASFFPGVKMVDSDTIAYSAKNYYDVLVVFKYLL